MQRKQQTSATSNPREISHPMSDRLTQVSTKQVVDPALKTNNTASTTATKAPSATSAPPSEKVVSSTTTGDRPHSSATTTTTTTTVSPSTSASSNSKTSIPDPNHVTAAKDNHGDNVPLFKTFDDMELRDPVLRGVFSFGFEEPSPIQQKAVIPIRNGGDVIVQAQSGTGKTGAFAIGILEQLDISNPVCQALVLSPTRELAQQTELVFAALGDYLGVKTFCAMGGTRVSEDLAALKRGVHVICGTPGRVFDHIRRGNLDPRSIRSLVLDEVDVMLSIGFQEQVQDIFRTLPRDTQAVAVSATLPQDVLAITEKFLRSPTRILLPPEEIPLQAISQFYVDCEKEAFKLDVLCDLFEMMSLTKTVIFCNSRTSAERLSAGMQERDFSVSVLHSDMTPIERNQRMKEFRHGATRVLIATDLLARGIDVQQVSIVVNYDLPRDISNYIHRIGRGGRHGRSAVAINLVTERDSRTLTDIERFYKIAIKEMPATIASLI